MMDLNVVMDDESQVGLSSDIISDFAAEFELTRKRKKYGDLKPFEKDDFECLPIQFFSFVNGEVRIGPRNTSEFAYCRICDKLVPKHHHYDTAQHAEEAAKMMTKREVVCCVERYNTKRIWGYNICTRCGRVRQRRKKKKKKDGFDDHDASYFGAGETSDANRAYAMHYAALLSFCNNGTQQDMMDAINSGQFEWGEGLINAVLDSKRSAFVNFHDWQGYTALHFLCQMRGVNVSEQVSTLIAMGADVNARDGLECTPLHNAAMSGNAHIVRKLLESNASIEMRNKNLSTPLMDAAFCGDELVVRVLLDFGANVNVRNQYGSTPLHFAAYHGHEAIVNALLMCNASTEAIQINRQTPLHCATFMGHERIVRLLLESGAVADAKDTDDWTPLHYAAVRGSAESARLLLDYGASVNAVNNYEWTPLHHAADFGNEAVARILIRGGADVNATNFYKWTPLHYAAGNQRESVVRLLVDSCANMDSRDDDGVSPRELLASLSPLLRSPATLSGSSLTHPAFLRTA